MTNLERIKQFTDEEMATFMYRLAVNYCTDTPCNGCKVCEIPILSKDLTKDWLNEETE